MDSYTQIQEKIQSLSDSISLAHPQMPSLLREIRTTLKNDPALVTLLSEDEIQIIVLGLGKQTDTMIATAISKPSAAKAKALKNVTDDDLGF